MTTLRHQFRAVLLTDDPRFGLFANDILVCEMSDWDPENKWNVIHRESDGYEPNCSVYQTQVRILEKVREKDWERIVKIARDAYHMHSIESRWEDLHPMDQKNYMGYTQWVLEVVKREEVLRNER